MTLAISTSSPLISVAVFAGEELHFSKSEIANQNASGLVANWVTEAVPDFCVIDRIVIDIGPGGFTGVKVGVTMAQMFAFASGVDVYAITAFDLISPKRNVAIPYKKGNYCVREVGSEPYLSSQISHLEYCGYGIEGVQEVYPTLDWKNIESCCKLTSLDHLVPLYVAEPSISIPKQPFAPL